MIIKLEYKSVADLVFLEEVDIESQNPNIEYEDGNSSPGGEVPWENTFIDTVDLQALILNDSDQNTK